MKRPDDPCRRAGCGHPRSSHQHYDGGTWCGSCGHGGCGRFLRPWKADRLAAAPPPAAAAPPPGEPPPRGVPGQITTKMSIYILSCFCRVTLYPDGERDEARCAEHPCHWCLLRYHQVTGTWTVRACPAHDGQGAAV